jgi:hypothetical protein
MRFSRQCILARLLIGLVALLGPISVLIAAESTVVEDPEALLHRIRSKVAEHLSQLPNYTCHEVINRLFRPLNNSSGQMDTVELEVAFLGGKELFSRAGESQFQDQPISKIVSAGTIGSGSFGSLADSVFVEDSASFRYVGQSKKDGHYSVHYEFEVPQEKSHFLLQRAGAHGIVGYKGSFWADIDTLDLVQMEIKADRIPSTLGIRFVEEKMRYTPVRIRDSEFLLPRHTELAASDAAGNYSLNATSLEKCREFVGQSVVTFQTPGDGASADRQAPEQ